jgi:hypothetical protein
MRKKAIRNILLSAGAYYVSSWFETAVVLAFAPITNRLRFTGDFEATVVMPIALGIPSALVMAITGAATAWVVESERPTLWALLPAVAYGISSAVAPHWVRPPETTADRVFPVLQALFPAVACIAGAATLRTRLRHPKGVGNERAVEQGDEADEA